MVTISLSHLSIATMAARKASLDFATGLRSAVVCNAYAGGLTGAIAGLRYGYHTGINGTDSTIRAPVGAAAGAMVGTVIGAVAIAAAPLFFTFGTWTEERN